MKCETKVKGRLALQWTLTALYCPHCSAKAVWEAEDGDYYSGPQFLCVDCCGEFFMPGSPDSDRLDNVEMAKAIREADQAPEPSDSIPSA